MTKRKLLLLILPILVLLGAVGGWAYWTTTGTGTASASNGTLSAPTITNATPSGGTVALTWSAVTPPQPDTVTYYVSRDGGTPAGNCPTAASPTGVLTCTDSGVSSGPYNYTVTAVWRTWTATSATTTVTVVAQSLDHFTVTPATGTQTAGTAFSVTVTAKDSSNATITSYTGTIHFTSSDGQASLPGDYTFTTGGGNDNGVHTFTNGVTLNTAGASKTVTVTDTGKTGTATYTVVHGPATQITLTGSTTDLGSGSSQTYTATIKDAAGNTVTTGADSTVSVSFAQAGGTGSVSGTGASPAVAGVATKSLTGNLAGSVTIRGSTTLSGPGATNSNTLTFAVTFGPATQIGLMGSTAALASGTPRTVTATIRDAAGNAVTSGADSSVSVTFGQLSGSGSVTGLGSSTASAGVATKTVTGSIAGPVDLRATATLSGPGSTNSNLLSFTVTFGTATQIALSGSNPDLASGTTRPFTATVQDAAGNTVTSGADSSASITFSQTAGTGSLSGLGAATASNGVAAKTVTGVLAGPVTLRANGTINSTAINSNTLGFNVTFGAATQVALTGATTPLASGTTRTVTATIKDAAGNTVTSGADSSVNVTFAQTGGSGSVSGMGNATASGGSATKTVTGALTGTVNFQASATLSGPGATNSNTLTFTVTFGTASQILLSGSTTDLAAGANRTFTATVQDAAGNTVTSGTDSSASITFAKTTGAGSVTGLTTVAASAGVASDIVTGATAGSVTLRANGTINAIATNSNTLTLNVTAGAVSQLVFTTQPGGATGGTALSPQPVVTAEDAGGNTITGYTGTVTLSIKANTGTTGATLSGCAGALTNGVTTFSSCKIDLAGTNYRLLATDGTLTSSPTNTFNITVGPAATLLVSGYTDPTIAGVSHILTVTAKDAGGNTATGYSGTVHLTSSDAQAVLGANATLTSGTGTFSATLKTAGDQSITATDTVTSTITGSQSGITVNPAAATVMRFVNCSLPVGNTICTGQPIAMGNGGDMTFNMQTQDPFGNPSAPTATITVNFTNSDGTFTITAGAPASITTASTTSGQVTLHHGINGGTDTLTATASSGFAPVTLTAKK
jgi:hypothetical protein